MKTNIVLTLAFLFHFAVNAQVTFEKIITKGSTEQGSSVVQTSDGGYAFLLNVLISDSRTDLWLVRTNFQGDTIWTRTFSRAGYNQIGDRAMIEAADGGITIIANRNGIASLLHTSSTGDSVWEKVVCTGQGFSLSGSSNGQYVVAARYATFLTKVVLTEPNGDLIWQKQFRLTPAGGLGSARGWTVRAVNNDGFIVAGEITTGYFTSRPFLFRLGSSGDSLWYREYELFGDEVIYSLDACNDNGFIGAGLTRPSENALIMRFNESGDTMWTRVLYYPGFQYFKTIRTTSDGGAITCGSYENLGNSNSVFLVKLSSSGTIMWEKEIGNYQNSYGVSIECTIDNSFIIGGDYQQSQVSANHGILLKTDANGNILAIGEGMEEMNIVFYPNPATNEFIVTIPTELLNQKQLTLRLYNSRGELIHNEPVMTGKDKITMNAGGYAKGLYQVSLGNGKNWYTGKVVIE